MKQGSKKHTHKYIIMIIVLVGVFMSVLDGIVVNIALPTITKAFSVDITSSQWIITAYLLTLASLMLFFGRLSEFTGRVPLFIVGFGIFTLASLACGFSATLTELVIFRVIQSMGGAMVFSIAGAILFAAFPPNERGRAMGYLGSTIAVGSIVGPILGGFLVDAFGWQYIFLINVPIGIILVICALLFLRIPEEKHPIFHMDWIGAASFASTVFFFMLFLSHLGHMTSLLVLVGSAVLFVGSGVIFAFRELRYDKPLLDLKIFCTRAFMLPVVALAIFFMSSFMINVSMPFYFEQVMGFHPTQVGLIFLIVPTILIFGSPIGGWLYDKRHWKHYGTVGIAVMALSFLILGVIVHSWISVSAIAAALILLALGSSLFQSPNNTEVMNSLPHTHLGIASSVSSVIRTLGMTLGVSLSSILLPLQIRLFGFENVFKATKEALSVATGNVILIAGILCIAAVFVLMRDHSKKTCG
jgi:EmrB/QacA subfamily drug resistance transporter